MLTTDDDLSRAMTMIDVELSDKDQNRIKLYIFRWIQLGKFIKFKYFWY